MTVRVREVHGRRLHPLVMDRSPDRDAVLFEGHHRPLEIILAHAEGQVLDRPVGGILLENHHAGLVSHPQEEPVPPVIAEPRREPEQIAVEGL